MTRAVSLAAMALIAVALYLDRAIERVRGRK